MVSRSRYNKKTVGNFPIWCKELCRIFHVETHKGASEEVAKATNEAHRGCGGTEGGVHKSMVCYVRGVLKYLKMWPLQVGS